MYIYAYIIYNGTFGARTIKRVFDVEREVAPRFEVEPCIIKVQDLHTQIINYALDTHTVHKCFDVYLELEAFEEKNTPQNCAHAHT
jgi:hypothetical protein